MSGQKVTIEVHDKESKPAEKVQVKEKDTKRKEHCKKYFGLLGAECKDFGINAYKFFGNILYIFLYALIVLGDLFLIAAGNQKKKSSKDSKKETNILDQGW